MVSKFSEQSASGLKNAYLDVFVNSFHPAVSDFFLSLGQIGSGHYSVQAGDGVGFILFNLIALSVSSQCIEATYNLKDIIILDIPMGVNTVGSLV